MVWVSFYEVCVMAKKSKRYRAMVGEDGPAVDPVVLEKAIETLKTYGTTKFDQTVEIAARLGIDPKQADQIVRGSIVLPHGIGRTLRVVVFAKGDKLDEANEAGERVSDIRLVPAVWNEELFSAFVDDDETCRRLGRFGFNQTFDNGDVAGEIDGERFEVLFRAIRIEDEIRRSELEPSLEFEASDSRFDPGPVRTNTR